MTRQTDRCRWVADDMGDETRGVAVVGEGNDGGNLGREQIAEIVGSEPCTDIIEKKSTVGTLG